MRKALPESPLELLLRIMRTEPPANATVAQKLRWRDQSMKAAVAAAPYVHHLPEAVPSELNEDEGGSP